MGDHKRRRKKKEKANGIEEQSPGNGTIRVTMVTTTTARVQGTSGRGTVVFFALDHLWWQIVQGAA
jgi:hypothetical protein